MAAKLVVDKFLPFTFFSSGPSWTELVGVLTSGNIPFSALPSQRVKHLIVEMYHATKNVSRVYVYRLICVQHRSTSGNSITLDLIKLA